jgi:hypothetical protein
MLPESAADSPSIDDRMRAATRLSVGQRPHAHLGCAMDFEHDWALERAIDLDHYRVIDLQIGGSDHD